MIKVCFVSHHFQSPAVLLKTIIKMTPGYSGKWKDMIAVTDPFEADVVACLDGLSNIPVPQDRCMYFSQHPKGMSAYKPLNDKGKCLGVFPNDTSLNPGEWWISHSYDVLSAMEAPKKTKDLISITTYRQHDTKPTYEHRITFLEEYVKKSKNIDVYGRQEAKFRNNPILKEVYKGVAGISEDKCNYKAGDHIIGKDIEIDYRYALDFDHGCDRTGLPARNYFSERLYDSMLLWTMPIYFGSYNVQDFLPKESFFPIDISGSLEYIQQQCDIASAIVDSNYRELHIKDIEEARYLLLNKHQIFPFVYDKIKAL